MTIDLPHLIIKNPEFICSEEIDRRKSKIIFKNLSEDIYEFNYTIGQLLCEKIDEILLNICVDEQHFKNCITDIKNWKKENFINFK